MKILFRENVSGFNPSIINYKNKIFCTFRTGFLTGPERNENYLVELNQIDFDVSSPFRKIMISDEYEFFEDVRLFEYQDELLCFFTFVEKGKEQSQQWKVAYGVLDIESATITKIQNISHNSCLPEKNWVPFLENGELFLITNFFPIKILKANGSPGLFAMSEYYNSGKELEKWSYGQLRCGTPFIKYQEWQYNFTHSHIRFYNDYKEECRKYVFTILRYSHERHEIQYYQKPIIPMPNEKEDFRKTIYGYLNCVFPVGIMNYKNGVIVSYGKDDYESRIEYFTWENVLKLFQSEFVSKTIL